MPKNTARNHVVALLNVGEIDHSRTGTNNTYYDRFVR